MNLELARLLEKQITSALHLADSNELFDLAIKLNEALVLVDGVGSEPPAVLRHTHDPGMLVTDHGCEPNEHR